MSRPRKLPQEQLPLQKDTKNNSCGSRGIRKVLYGTGFLPVPFFCLRGEVLSLSGVRMNVNKSFPAFSGGFYAGLYQRTIEFSVSMHLHL